MAEAFLNINESILEGVITKAIIESITPEARDKMLAGAIDSLLAAPKEGNRGYNAYGSNKKSNLESALEQAVYTTALKVANEELLKDPRLYARIQEMISPLIAGILDEDYSDEIAQAMGRALVGAIKGKRD